MIAEALSPKQSWWWEFPMYSNFIETRSPTLNACEQVFFDVSLGGFFFLEAIRLLEQPFLVVFCAL